MSDNFSPKQDNKPTPRSLHSISFPETPSNPLLVALLLVLKLRTALDHLSPNIAVEGLGYFKAIGIACEGDRKLNPARTSYFVLCKLGNYEEGRGDELLTGLGLTTGLTTTMASLLERMGSKRLAITSRLMFQTPPYAPRICGRRICVGDFLVDSSNLPPLSWESIISRRLSKRIAMLLVFRIEDIVS